MVAHSASPSTNLLTNGDFESGTLAGWTVNDGGEPTGVASGVRTLAGLEVQRFFYTVPNKFWGRWTDVFTNNTGAAVTTDVVYRSNLGSDGAGVVYATNGGKALAEWDTCSGDRDVGMAFGNLGVFFETEVDMACGYNADDNVYMVKRITIPAGGSAAVVNFIVMNGVDTRNTATDVTARATAVEAELTAITGNFRTDPQYRDGLTAAQIAAIVNW